MNFNIVPRQFDGETIQTVNARELHETLNVGRDFTTWVKGRIGQFGFAENTDYVVFTNSGESNAFSPESVNQKSGRGGDRRSVASIRYRRAHRRWQRNCTKQRADNDNHKHRTIYRHATGASKRAA